MLINQLPDGITLQLYALHGASGLPEKVLFSSSKKWLHPLFDLESFLAQNKQSFASEELLLRDRVIGRAAAFLITRLGIKNLETDLLSRLAIPLFEKESVKFSAVKTVDDIDCMTENLLKTLKDPEEIYAMLLARRQKALAS